MATTGPALMGCLEEQLRQALREDGRKCLEALLNDPTVNVPGDSTQPGEHCHAQRPNTVDSLFGPLELRRNYYSRADRSSGRAPLDQSLGLVEGWPPGPARLMARAGALEPFADASQSLQEYAGVRVSGRRIQRLLQVLGPEFARWNQSQPAPASLPKGTTFYVEADGTGIPVRPEATVGRAGKGEDGQAKTREIKVGVTFTQDPLEGPAPARPSPQSPARPVAGEAALAVVPRESEADSPRPQRTPGSTRYITTTENVHQFGQELLDLARRQALALAALVVFLGDGAAWVWELARVCFPGGLLILDFFHAAEHVGLLTEILFGKDTPQAEGHRQRWVHILKDQPGGVERVIALAREALPARGKVRRAAQKALAYFENNRDKMQYWDYQRRHLFIGSGVVEAGCKSVVGQRCKQSGMFWSLAGAENLLSIRCVLENGQFNECWDHRFPMLLALPKAA